MLALVNAFPQDIHTRERCSCGEVDCDECPSAEEAARAVERLRAEVEADRRG